MPADNGRRNRRSVSGELVIQDRGACGRTIAMRQDEADATKWHLAEPVILDCLETANFVVNGLIVETIDGPTSSPINTLFHTPRG